MTAQGEDILAYLDSAITKAAGDANRWHDIECDVHAIGLTDLADILMATEVPGAVCDCTGPASVLRRCAADRKAMALYSDTVAIRDKSAALLRDAQDRSVHPAPSALDDWNRANREAAMMLPLVQLLAEGYGWTEGER